VVLIQVEERVGRERAGKPAPPAERGEDLVLVDRVRVVEADDVHGSVRYLAASGEVW